MTTPICLSCRRLMRCIKTGEYVLLHVDEPDRYGNLNPKPHQVWAGDTYECPWCGAQVVTGFAEQPLSEAHEPGLAQAVERLSPVGVHS